MQAQPPVGDSAPSLRILVVDDEPLLRWSIAEALEESGNTVMAAGDGESAISAIRHTPDADVILLDYCLPDSAEFSIVEDIRRIAPQTPIVMMTAFGTNEIEQRARDFGIHQLLNKPVDVFQLDNILRSACAPLVAEELED